jgi:GNAT superfamily N-acetyltransferase
MEDAVIEGLPAGLAQRPATTADVDAIFELVAAAELDLDGAVETDRDDVAMQFGRSGFDPAEDCQLVFEGATPVAWTEAYRDRAEADVRPSHRGRGLGAALLAWSERIDDAFGEWEGRDPIPFEEWAGYVTRHPSFAPQVSPLAFEGDELVGAVLSFDDAGTEEGWIHQLATKATHRHRGIARALLHSAFGAFHAEGKTRCGLSTVSRTGALTLYERVGMSVRRSYTRYTKLLG